MKSPSTSLSIWYRVLIDIGSDIKCCTHSHFDVPFSYNSIHSATVSSVNQTGQLICSTGKYHPNSYLMLFCIHLNSNLSSSSFRCLIATCSSNQLVMLFRWSLFFAAANILSIGLNVGVYWGIVNARSFRLTKNSLMQSCLCILALSNKKTSLFQTIFHSSS